MREKYAKIGLNYDLILEKYPNIDNYEETVNAFLNDPFFKELKTMLEDEDYAMAMDAIKGLYILASELCLFPLYEALLDIYEDLEYEDYKDTLNKYNEMINIYNNIRSIFNV